MNRASKKAVDLARFLRRGIGKAPPSWTGGDCGTNLEERHRKNSTDLEISVEITTDLEFAAEISAA